MNPIFIIPITAVILGLVAYIVYFIIHICKLLTQTRSDLTQAQSELQQVQSDRSDLIEKLQNLSYLLQTERVNRAAWEEKCRRLEEYIADIVTYNRCTLGAAKGHIDVEFPEEMLATLERVIQKEPDEVIPF